MNLRIQLSSILLVGLLAAAASAEVIRCPH